MCPTQADGSGGRSEVDADGAQTDTDVGDGARADGLLDAVFRPLGQGRVVTASADNRLPDDISEAPALIATPPSPPPPLPPCRTPVVAVRPCCTPAARPYGVRPCHREWLRHRPPRYMQIPGYSSATSRFQESKCADSRILFRTFQFPSFRVSYFRSCTHSFDSLFIHMRCQARQLAQIFNSSTLLSISTADRTHARTGPDTDTQRASLLGE